MMIGTKTTRWFLPGQGSIYILLRSVEVIGGDSICEYKIMWNKSVLLKVYLFAWCYLNNRSPTKEDLHQRVNYHFYMHGGEVI